MFKYRAELDELIEAWTLQWEKRAVAELLQSAGVPAGPVLRDRELFSDPHLTARGLFQEATHTTIGTHLYPGMLWKYSETPMNIRLAPAALGEHNRMVFQEVLGFSEGEYRSLEEEGLIGNTYGLTAQLDARDQATSPAVR